MADEDVDEDREPCKSCGNLSLLVIGRRMRGLLLEVNRERDRQDAKRGKDHDHDPLTWSAILTEEVGEVAQAALKLRWEGGNINRIRDELIQVAAVALAAVQHFEAGSTGLHGIEEWTLHYGDRVFQERMFQEEKWGTRFSNDMDPYDWLTVLTAELGEAAEAALISRGHKT